MVEIAPEPASLVFDTMPGESRTRVTAVFPAPEDGGITATVEGDPRFRVERVTVFEMVTRPLSADEIAQLPPHLQEEASKSGALVWEPTASSDGMAPLAVPHGVHERPTVQIAVELASGEDPKVAAATLVLNGGSWDRTEVPVVALRSAATVPVQFEPAEVSRAAEPGEVVRPFFTATTPEMATVLPILTKGIHARIVDHAVYVSERHEFTDEEIAQLPPHPPELREEAREKGYLVWRQVGRAPAGEPLSVPGGARYQVFLEIAVPATDPPLQIRDTLFVYATTWQRMLLPIQVEVAGLVVVPSSDVVSIRQGEESAPFDIALGLHAGADTNVTFRVGREGDPFQVQPSTVHLDQGERVTASLRISVSSTDPFLGSYPLYLGDYDLGLTVTAFGGTWEREFPLRLRFLSGTVTVGLLQTSVAALQGERTTCQVQVVVGGGYKRVNFEGARLPRGVRMDPAVTTTTGPSTTPLALQFAVDRDALPADRELATVNWSANDGEQTGVLQFPFTVVRVPETVTFNQRIVTPTGTALGGEAGMVFSNDGSGRFRGYMRATGFPSYKFRVRAVVRSADGRLAVMGQKSGAVYGFDTPGDRQFDWDDNAGSDFVGEQWPTVRTATLAVTKSYEMTGVLGTLADIVGDVVEFAATAVATSPTLAGIILVGSELADLADVHVVGAGGLVGLVAAGGASFLYGGGVILPVLVGGIVTSDQLVGHRPLFKHEIGFARRVFQNTLPFDRIRVTNLSGIGGREFVTPSIDGTILVNMGNGFSDPIAHIDPPKGKTEEGQIFVHELTHVWQVAHTDFVSEFFWRAALDKLNDSASYTYGPPGPAFSSFGLEAQASLVEEWFSGTQWKASTMAPGRPPRGTRPESAQKMNPDDPYFRYIANNIRLSEA